MSEQKLLPFSAEVKLDYEGRTIEGYAAAFNNVDLVNDVIVPGAFAKTLVERGSRVKLLWQHDTKQPLGKILEMKEDPRGLFFKAIISDTQAGRDALALLRDGAIEGMSIGYDPMDHEYMKVDGKVVRQLKQLRLHEISLVTMPANPEAGVTALKDAEPEAPAEPAPQEDKAGRIIAKRNAVRLRTIRKLLQELVDDGGLELDEDDDEPEAPAKRAAEDKPDAKPTKAEAGPDAITAEPPTFDIRALELEIETETLRLLEV
jgi:uncharacterized protein